MALKVTIVTLDHPYTGALVVEAPYLDKQKVVFPPEPGLVEFAEWLDDERIVLIAKPTYKKSCTSTMHALTLSRGQPSLRN